MIHLERGCPLTWVLEEKSPAHQAPCLRPTTLTPGFQHLAENGNCGGNPICPWVMKWAENIEEASSSRLTITDLCAGKDPTVVTGVLHSDLSLFYSDSWKPFLSTQTMPFHIESGSVWFPKNTPQYEKGSKKPDYNHPYSTLMHQFLSMDQDLVERIFVDPNNPPEETPGT